MSISPTHLFKSPTSFVKLNNEQEINDVQPFPFEKLPEDLRERICFYLDKHTRFSLNATSTSMREFIDTFSATEDPTYVLKLSKATKKYFAWKDEENEKARQAAKKKCMRVVAGMTLPVTVPAMSVVCVATTPCALSGAAGFCIAGTCCPGCQDCEEGCCCIPTVRIIEAIGNLFSFVFCGVKDRCSIDLKSSLM